MFRNWLSFCPQIGIEFLKKIFLTFLRSSPILLPVVFVYRALDQALTNQLEYEMLSTKTSELAVWSLAGTSMIISLIFPLLCLLIVLANSYEKSSLQYLKLHFSQCLKESLRAWGKVILWSILFIIPGLIQMVRMAFVPFIAVHSEDYQAGRVDALKGSATLARSQFWRLLIVFLVFSVLIPLFMTAFDDYKILWTTPVPAFLLGVVEAFFMVVFYEILLRLFQRSQKNVGAHF